MKKLTLPHTSPFNN